MSSKTYSAIVIFIVILVGYFVARYEALSPKAGDRPASADATAGKVKINPPDINLPFSNSPKDAAWAVFQKYLDYNKNRDLEGVRSIVYKIAPVCEDPKTRVDCEARMGMAYEYGNALKKGDFTNVWSDEKQTILASDFKIEEEGNSIGRFRVIIFFVKDSAGNLKMLSFSPFKGAETGKSGASAEEINDRLIRYTEDKDEDGLADYIEECIPADIKETCVPTNPKIRDTDGDGLWDGVEYLMK